MKRLALLIVFISTIGAGLKAQEKFSALNIGAGVGYYGYYYGAAPALSLNYEFDVLKDFTLAPFIAFATYKSYRYWGDIYYPYRDYYYRETIMPLGVKATYYFDRIFEAGEDWDFYVAGSLGAAIRTVRWENGYNGDRVVRTSSPLYGSLHLGAEYHFNSKVGLFADVSTAFSTIGLGIHF